MLKKYHILRSSSERLRISLWGSDLGTLITLANSINTQASINTIPLTGLQGKPYLIELDYIGNPSPEQKEMVNEILSKVLKRSSLEGL